MTTLTCAGLRRIRSTSVMSSCRPGSIPTITLIPRWSHCSRISRARCSVATRTTAGCLSVPTFATPPSSPRKTGLGPRMTPQPTGILHRLYERVQERSSDSGPVADGPQNAMGRHEGRSDWIGGHLDFQSTTSTGCSHPCAATVMPQRICPGGSATQACRNDTNLTGALMYRDIR